MHSLHTSEREEIRDDPAGDAAVGPVRQGDPGQALKAFPLQFAGRSTAEKRLQASSNSSCRSVSRVAGFGVRSRICKPADHSRVAAPKEDFGQHAALAGQKLWQGDAKSEHVQSAIYPKRAVREWLGLLGRWP